MNVRSIQDLLAGHEFFAGLEPEQLAFIAGCGVNTRFARGTYLFREGDQADRFYVVRSGRVALELFAPGRGAAVIETVDAGGVVGVDWLVEPYRWTADARAMEDVGAIALDGKCIRDRCEAEPAMGFHLMRRLAAALERRLQSTRLRLLDIYGGHRVG